MICQSKLQSWPVQNFVVISRAHFKPDHDKFWANFECDRNIIIGTGARWRYDASWTHWLSGVMFGHVQFSAKSVTLCMSRRGRFILMHFYSSYGEILDSVDHPKYLSINISHDLIWSAASSLRGTHIYWICQATHAWPPDVSLHAPTVSRKKKQ